MEHIFLKKDSAVRRHLSPNKTGIPNKMKNQFEAYSGKPFDSVQAHYNSDKPKQMQALAYTQADHDYAASGQVRYPGHELGYIAQQRKGQVHATDLREGQGNPGKEVVQRRVIIGGQIYQDSSVLWNDPGFVGLLGTIQENNFVAGIQEVQQGEWESVLEILFAESDNASMLYCDGTQPLEKVSYVRGFLSIESLLGHLWNVLGNGNQQMQESPEEEVVQRRIIIGKEMCQDSSVLWNVPAFVASLNAMLQGRDAAAGVSEMPVDTCKRALEILFAESAEANMPYCDGVVSVPEISFVRVFCTNESFLVHLIKAWMSESQADETELNQAEVTENATPMQGAYGRFPTIYSYGFMNSSGAVSSSNQGPHTLAHVSVSYLMDHPLPGRDVAGIYMSQVISPDEVMAILKSLGVEDNIKAAKYIEDYQGKYEELQRYCTIAQYVLARPNALLRELMEMHPMAVYSWLTNIKTGNVKRASLRNRSGKGETYGATIYLDKGWQSIQTPNKEQYVAHMKEYLARRLSMSIIESRIPKVIEELMKEGSYTITDIDRGLQVPGTIPAFSQ